MDKWKVRKTDSVLNLSGKNFLPDDVETIGMALKYTETYQFEKIDLSKQASIKDLELEEIFKIGNLGKNVSITSINLSNTKLADDGTKIIQRTLMTNKTLTSLDCRDCQEVTTEGARRLLNLVLHVPPPKPPEVVPVFKILDNSEALPGIVQPVIRDWSEIYSDILLPPSPKELPPIEVEAPQPVPNQKSFKKSVGRLRSLGGFGNNSKTIDIPKSKEQSPTKQDFNSISGTNPAASPSRKFKLTPSRPLWSSARNKVRLSLRKSGSKTPPHNPMTTSDTEADLLLADKLAEELATAIRGEYSTPKNGQKEASTTGGQGGEGDENEGEKNEIESAPSGSGTKTRTSSKGRKFGIWKSVGKKIGLSNRLLRKSSGSHASAIPEMTPEIKKALSQERISYTESTIAAMEIAKQMEKELGMEKGEMAKLTKTEDIPGMGILKKGTSSKRENRAGSIDEEKHPDDPCANDLPLSPPPLMSALSLERQESRAREVSFGGIDSAKSFKPTASPVIGSGREKRSGGGISFSESTVSKGDTDETDEEKKADELAKSLAKLVVGGGGTSSTPSIVGATRSAKAAKSWRERAKR